MKLSLTIKTGPKEYAQSYARLGRAFGPAVDRGIARGSGYVVMSLRARTTLKGKNDTLAMLRGWAANPGHYKVVFYNRAAHALYVERGRQAGSMPPVAAISAWAGRKLGNPRLGWPIAKAIARRGIRPTPILRDPAVGARAKVIIDREIRIDLERAKRRARGA